MLLHVPARSLQQLETQLGNEAKGVAPPGMPPGGPCGFATARATMGAAAIAYFMVNGLLENGSVAENRALKIGNHKDVLLL